MVSVSAVTPIHGARERASRWWKAQTLVRLSAIHPHKLFSFPYTVNLTLQIQNFNIKLH